MGTIGVYVDEDDDPELVDEFDDVVAAAWPEGQTPHRSAAMRALLRAVARAGPELVAAGVLPPDAEGVDTAEDAEDAVADAFEHALAAGAAAAALVEHGELLAEAGGGDS